MLQQTTLMDGHVLAGPIHLPVTAHGTGPPVLFSVGLDNGRTVWDPQVAAWRDTRCCVTSDQRDVGESAPATSPYTARDLAADAAGLLDALAIPRSAVVGWALGAAVAQEQAIGWPDRVDRLTLLATDPASDARGAAKLRDGALTPLRFARQLRATISDSVVRVLAGAGDALVCTRDKDVNPTLLRFLSTQD